MSDAANFDRVALQRIYGDSPCCFICPRYKAQDFHHIYGRTINGSRIVASSVLNACPISRDLHSTCPFLNNPDFQRILYQHAMKHVNLAIAKGDYEYTVEDLALMEWVNSTEE